MLCRVCGWCIDFLDKISREKQKKEQYGFSIKAKWLLKISFKVKRKQIMAVVKSHRFRGSNLAEHEMSIIARTAQTTVQHEHVVAETTGSGRQSSSSEPDSPSN